MNADLLAISDNAAKVTVWFASLPDPKPTCFTCSDLTTGTGLSMRQLHYPLVAILGWQRASIWSRRGNRRVRRVYYAPPGGHMDKPPRGRPPFNLSDYLTINIL